MEFQSRNRGSFDFKTSHTYPSSRCSRTFQSRNRGSFDFKAIEVTAPALPVPEQFQSRNRGSFDFKSKDDYRKIHTLSCFNLVIEVLLISSLLMVG